MSVVIKRSKPRTNTQMADMQADNVLVFDTTDGRSKVAIDLNQRWTIRNWTCYAMVKAGRSLTATKCMPGIALQYKSGTRFTLVDRVQLAALRSPSLNGDTDRMTRNFFRTAMENAGLENTVNDRAELTRTLDEFLKETFQFKMGWHRQVGKEIRKQKRTGVEIEAKDDSDKTVMEGQF